MNSNEEHFSFDGCYNNNGNNYINNNNNNATTMIKSIFSVTDAFVYLLFLAVLSDFVACRFHVPKRGFDLACREEGETREGRKAGHGAEDGRKRTRSSQRFSRAEG